MSLSKRMRRCALLLGAASGLALSCASAAAQTAFGSIGGATASDSSYANDISADGLVIVGGVTTSAGNEAAFWTLSGGLVTIGDLPGGVLDSAAAGADADGSVIVGYGTTAAGRQAFRWEGGTMTALPLTPGAASSEAYGVNADGSAIVGYQLFGSRPEAFQWTPGGGMQNLGGLSVANVSWGRAVSADGTFVVGESENASRAVEAFRWTARTGMVGLGFLPGDIGSSAADVSSNGRVVVGASTNPSGGFREAYVWTEGASMRALGYLPGHNESYAMAVSGDGALVVGVSALRATSGGEMQAFLWNEEEGLHSVADRLTVDGVNIGTWQLRSATGASGDGTVIVGEGVNPSGRPEGWWARLGAGTSPPPPPPPGGGSPPPPPPGGGSPPPSSGLLGSDVLSDSAGSTSAANQSQGSSTQGHLIAIHYSRGSGSGSNLVGDYFSSASPRPAQHARTGEMRAFAFGRTSDFNGDISNADSVDTTWGFSYQATPGLRFASAYHYVSIDGALPAYDGAVEVEDRALQAFLAYEPETSGLRAYIAAGFGASDATIDRGYLNGVTPEISSGARDGRSFALTALLGWTAPVGAASVMPFVQYDAKHVELDAYEETGGTFPARFDEWEDTSQVSRLGVEARAPVSGRVEALGSLAWGHRFDNRLAAITGEVIGVTPFAVPGARIERDWTEAGAGLVWSPSDGVDVSFRLNASTDGDTTPDFSGLIGVAMRL